MGINSRIKRLEELYKQRERVSQETRKLKDLLVIERRATNRPNLLSFRVTDSEYKQIIDICDAYEISRSELLREIVLGEIERVT
jgi:hypothetical protein